jgi:phage shock protein A
MENTYNQFVANLEMLVQAFNYVQSNTTTLDKRLTLVHKNKEVMSDRIDALKEAWEALTEEMEEALKSN